MITVVSAPPFATIQDAGRTGFRDIGVPPSGFADRDSAFFLNRLLGNGDDCAMIEWAVARGTLRFETATMIAVGGAEAVCVAGGKLLEPWTPTQMPARSELVVERLVRGRFLLIAVAGGIDVPRVMGSRSTLVSASLGGHEGRRLRTGDTLRIGAAQPHAETVRERPPLVSSETVPVMRGPQASLFDDEMWSTFVSASYIVSRASDRSGYRLDGPVLRHHGSIALPSEPACVGAIQAPDGGSPIVIMPDGPTVGGYPKIAVIRSHALSRFAQLAPGDSVRFTIDEN